MSISIIFIWFPLMVNYIWKVCSCFPRNVVCTNKYDTMRLFFRIADTLFSTPWCSFLPFIALIAMVKRKYLILGLQLEKQHKISYFEKYFNRFLERGMERKGERKRNIYVRATSCMTWPGIKLATSQYSGQHPS